MLRITISRDGEHVLTADVDGDKALIGREEYCDVQIDHESISRKHASLSLREDGDWWIKDAGSANGVKVNGKAIVGEATVRADDTVTLGPFAMSFKLLDTATSALRRSEIMRKPGAKEGTTSTVIVSKDVAPGAPKPTDTAQQLRLRILIAVAVVVTLLVVWRIYSIVMTPDGPKPAEQTWVTDEFGEPVVLLGSRLEIIATPPGVDVLLNDTVVATTEPDPDAPWRSKPVVVPVDSSATNMLRLRYAGAKTAERLATVKPDEIRRVEMTLWLPNRRVRLADGTEFVAMLTGESKTHITLAREAGKEHRFTRQEIAEITTIPPIAMKTMEGVEVDTIDGAQQLRLDPFPDGPDSTNRP